MGSICVRVRSYAIYTYFCEGNAEAELSTACGRHYISITDMKNGRRKLGAKDFLDSESDGLNGIRRCQLSKCGRDLMCCRIGDKERKGFWTRGGAERMEEGMKTLILF